PLLTYTTLFRSAGAAGRYRQRLAECAAQAGDLCVVPTAADRDWHARRGGAARAGRWLATGAGAPRGGDRAMTRLVFTSYSQSWKQHARRSDDLLVPLSEAARDEALAAEPDAPLADLPPFGAIQSAALVDAFEQARAILNTLADDPAWARLLRYRDYDLRPMAHKNLLFALEDAARVVHITRAAIEAHPGSAAILLDRDPAVARAVRAAIPGVELPDVAAEWRATLPERIRPLARFRSEEHTSELQSREKLVCR